MFGGVNRVRISSQSLKRAMRRPPKHAYDYWRETMGEPSIRSRELERLKAAFIGRLQGEFPEETIIQAVERFVATPGAPKDQEDEATEEEEPTEQDATTAKKKKLAVAPWALEEMRAICRIIQPISLTEAERQTVMDKYQRQTAKAKKSESTLRDEALDQKIAKAIKENLGTLRQAAASAVDIALFGRMATSGLMSSVDGSLSVAHAITTHAVEPSDVDWFTAVDDLVEGAGDTGAGHLDIQQFSSGVFYRYASLNLDQLLENLGSDSRPRALEIARHVAHLLATVVPSAKQNAYAAHNLADFVLVSFSHQPISLANAFERPIREERHQGYLRPSILGLTEYRHRLTQAFGLQEEVAAFAVQKEAITSTPHGAYGLTLFGTLAELESWIQNDGRE